MPPFRTLELDNGLQLAFFDRSNRYFGDYHRILVEVRATFELPVPEGDDAPFWEKARALFGERFTFTRTLERMAVPTAETVAVRDRLAEDFLETTGAYLQHPACRRNLVASALKHRPPRRGYGF